MDESCEQVALWEALVHGRPHIVKSLLKSQRVNPKHVIEYGILLASDTRNLQAVKALLTDGEFLPLELQNTLRILLIHEKGLDRRSDILQLMYELVKLLGVETTLLAAAKTGSVPVVEYLYTCSAIFNFLIPIDTLNLSLQVAASRGHVDVVRALLNDERVQPGESSNLAFRLASSHGHARVVALLLQDTRINPADVNNEALVQASSSGHTNVVRMLLSDTRINPGAEEDLAIRCASFNGHVEVVRMLQKSLPCSK